MLEPVYITNAEYIGDYKVELQFNDGLVALTDFENLLSGQLYEHLKDKSLFKNFELDGWTLTWPGPCDFSPEFLYQEAKRQTDKTENSSIV